MLILYSSIPSFLFVCYCYYIYYTYKCHKPNNTLLYLLFYIILFFFEKVERGKDGMYIFLEFVFLTLLYIVSGSLHFFLWIQVTMLYHLLVFNTALLLPTPLCSYCHQIYYISICYRSYNKIQYTMFYSIPF